MSLAHFLLLKNTNLKLNKITNNEGGLYVIFSDNKGPVMEIPVPKNKTDTSYFHENVALKNQSCRPETGTKYLQLLNDNAPAKNPAGLWPGL